MKRRRDIVGDTYESKRPIGITDPIDVTQNQLYEAVYNNKSEPRGGLSTPLLRKVLLLFEPDSQLRSRAELISKFKDPEIMREARAYFNYDYRYRNDIVNNMETLVYYGTEIILLGEKHGQDNRYELGALLATMDKNTVFLLEAGPDEKQGRSNSVNIDYALDYIHDPESKSTILGRIDQFDIRLDDSFQTTIQAVMQISKKGNKVIDSLLLAAFNYSQNIEIIAVAKILKTLHKKWILPSGRRIVRKSWDALDAEMKAVETLSANHIDNLASTVVDMYLCAKIIEYTRDPCVQRIIVLAGCGHIGTVLTVLHSFTLSHA